MNDRERYIAALTFAKPDRIPFMPGSGRESTRRQWRREGLPEEVTDYQAYVRELIGIEQDNAAPRSVPGVDLRMIPQFEEKVIDQRPGRDGAPGTLVVRDWKGNVCEISDEYDVTYLRGAKDFVTRSWLKCPVESRADWDDMARRYDPTDPARFSDDWAQQARRLHDRPCATRVIFSGPFWQLREWLGFEGLCMMLLDDPAFVEEMIELWDRFVGAMLERIFERHVPDQVLVNEDMAYKEKSMISPAMCRTFLMPTWRHWADLCRGAGVPVYAVDSDGCIDQLIPLWIESGFTMTEPIEVAAGNDLPAFRGQYGTTMAYHGGVDKRAMARGGKAIRDEFDRLRPAIDAGGYIPGCDHGIPADVSWPNFVDYCRLLAQATGWL